MRRGAEEVFKAKAQDVLEQVMGRLTAAGAADIAAQLAQGAYPDDDSLPHFAAVLGGSIVVTPPAQPGTIGDMVYGAGPIAMHVICLQVEDAEGHSSPHYELVKSWVPQNGDAADCSTWFLYTYPSPRERTRSRSASFA